MLNWEWSPSTGYEIRTKEGRIVAGLDLQYDDDDQHGYLVTVFCHDMRRAIPGLDCKFFRNRQAAEYAILSAYLEASNV